MHQRRSPAKAEHTVVGLREMFDGGQDENWARLSQVSALRCYRATLRLRTGTVVILRDEISGRRFEESVAHPLPAIRASIIGGIPCAVGARRGTEESNWD